MIRKMVMTEFVIMGCPGHFNEILGRPFLFKAKVVTSMYHLKFPVKDEVGKVTGEQAATRKCYAESIRNHDVLLILENQKMKNGTNWQNKWKKSRSQKVR